MNFVKFLKTLFLQSTSGQLLLQYRKEKRLFLRKQRNSTKECHIIPGKYVNLTRTQYLILPGCLEFVLQIIIQNTSISHARRQTFNRAPNFVKVPRLCTIQNASNSQAKIHLRTPFLQNSFQWLLSNFSYFLKKGKKQKQFFIPPLCLIRLKSCICIKIVKIVFIHNFAKRLLQSIFSILQIL